MCGASCLFFGGDITVILGVTGFRTDALSLRVVYWVFLDVLGVGDGVS